MSMRLDNLEKKWRPCLKCGRKVWTDRGHRLCGKCAKGNVREGSRKHAYRVPRGTASEELAFLLGDSRLTGD